MTAPAVWLLLGLGTALVPHRPDPARDYPPLPRLDAEVARCEAQLRAVATPEGREDAQFGLARARARRAAALGQRVEAARQWRRVIAHLETRRRALERMKAVICDDAPFREVHGELAAARAGLAQAEDHPEIVRAEMPKVIAYCEWRLERLRRLRAAVAVLETTAQEDDLHREIRRARAALAATQRRPAAGR